MKRPPVETRRLPWVTLPAAVYLTVTLAVPLANGAPLDALLAEHVLTTLVVTGAIGLAFALRGPR